jgi:hypothetical protein
MAIRLPLQGIKTYTEVDGNTPGASSVAGGTPIPFVIPMDTDNVIVKVKASVSGGGYSAIFQTTDDGGTTWYDVARSSIVSNTAGNYAADWLSIPVISPGINPAQKTLYAAGSIVGGTIGKSPASTLGAGQVSGLPIMGTVNRIFLVSTGTITATSLVSVEVKVNSQSATA